MDDPRVFRLFAACIPVAGATKAVVCDLQRGDYYEIPLSLYQLITEQQGRTMDQVKADYPAEDAAHIEQAFEMMVSSEFGFWSDAADDHFPPIDLTFDRPEEIDNAIIDVDRGSGHDYRAIFEQLEQLGCRHVELRCYDPITAEALDAALAPTLESRLRSIELIVPHAGWDQAGFERLCQAHARVASITVYGAPATRTDEIDRNWTLRFVTETITSPDDCGKIHPAFFATNLATFSEAQTRNSCLNKKVGIDAAGNIKNCPSHGTCHGSAATDSLVTIVRKESFRKPWAIARDQVEVCRDCEYRYICTDCRVFVTNPDDPLSKPAKCDYDPYSGTWS